MKIEVSNGEILDKISILEIKLEKISDDNKLTNIKAELNILRPMYAIIANRQDVEEKFIQLTVVNAKLWDIEDRLREKEFKKEFDEEFVELARSVYIQNDLRFDIKKEINLLSDSALIEEKSYGK